ncbi:MAG: AlpA family phage regulatory protein [Deltaproteobacteria bacterium]|nr:AlpA family phage regulatory protein [Deltaproteobacteria bacterium]
MNSYTGLSLNTVYDYTRTGRFPGSFSIGGRNRAWSLNAVNLWVADRKAGIPVPEGTYFPTQARDIREAVKLLRQPARKESR